ncbi:MAG: DUF2461 domain-containing protein [Thermoplasmata archaeon]|nr:DUF2461 domain-containing protein [Thermoplasmata archaeon]
MVSGEAPDRFFGPEAFRFLRDLRANNERDWFQANKERYERSVQAPALRFIEAMGPRLAKLSPHLVASARTSRGSLTRIYRDTRFSKDKSPYRANVGIHFFHDRGGKEQHLPGLYFHMAPGESSVAAGIWHPDLPALRKIRDHIVARPAEWGRVVGKGIKIGGESYVRAPSGYDPVHKYREDLRRKDFYSFQMFPDRVVTSPGFGKKFEATCRELDPLNKFLAAAVAVAW